MPLVASIVLLALAAWVRSSVGETPEFVGAQQRSEERPSPLRVLRQYPGTIVVLLLSYAGPACIYPMVTTFGVAYMKSTGGLASSTTFAVFLFAQLVAIGTALLGGRTADRICPRNAMLVALTALGVFFVPLFPIIGSGNIPLIGVCTAGVIASIIFALAAQAPFYACAFPVRMRYFGSSIAYTHVRRTWHRIPTLSRHDTSGPGSCSTDRAGHGASGINEPHRPAAERHEEVLGG